jgi:hypothetical protein
MSSQQRRESGTHFDILAAGAVEIGGALGGRCAAKRRIEDLEFAIRPHSPTPALPLCSPAGGHQNGHQIRLNQYSVVKQILVDSLAKSGIFTP